MGQQQFLAFLFTHSTIALLIAAPSPARADAYDDRLALLAQRVGAPWTNDACALTPETALDMRSFQELLNLEGHKILDDASGWSMIARTGGRPFSCFHDITADGQPVPFSASNYGVGTSGIPPAELDAHFAAGKQVNRLWFTHVASNGYPTVVVFTPDGFFNVAGIQAPMLQGAAVRTGFIGEPFGPSDFVGHVDELSVTVVSHDLLRILYNVHSEAGEGVVEVDLVWNARSETPELRFRASNLARFPATLGFVGLNWMKGPTMFGLKDCQPGDQGIEAFHDGRSVYAILPDRTHWRNGLVPPIGPGNVDREDIGTLPAGSKVVLDQPQRATGYFSKMPAGDLYEDRTDLVLTLEQASLPVTLRRAQTAVDLASSNPESSETANVFLAMPLQTGQVATAQYRLAPAQYGFEPNLCGLERGVAFVSAMGGSQQRLYFLPLGNSFQANGPPAALTDEVVVDPRRPDASSDGRLIAFDADDRGYSTRQRVHVLDRKSGSVRRVSSDVYGTSFDQSASLNFGASELAAATNRSGTFRLDTATTDAGMNCGPGDNLGPADHTDWSPARNEIATTSGGALSLYDVAGASAVPLSAHPNARNPDFSPSGDWLAFAADDGIFVIRRDGIQERSVLADGDHPTWADETHLIVQRTASAETDLYLLAIDVSPAAVTRLTPQDGIDATEPAFAPGSCAAGTDLFQPSEVATYDAGLWRLDTDGDGESGAGDDVFGLGFPGATPVTGDWNGDGRTKAGVYGAGFWYLDSNGDGVWDGGSADKLVPWGWVGAQPFVGDWNGDGRDSIGVYSAGFWFLDYDGNYQWDAGVHDTIVGWGWTGATPVVGDWNGSGATKIGVFNLGFWFLDYDGNFAWDGGVTDKVTGWGTGAETPIVGDWNGDGRSKIGTHLNGMSVIDFDGNYQWDNGVADKRWSVGWTGTTPLVGDWNGDLADEVGAFLDGNWYLDYDGNGMWEAGSDRVYHYGSAGNTPVTGKW